MARSIPWLCTGILGLILGLYIMRAQKRKNVEYIVLKHEAANHVSGSLFIRADLEPAVLSY